MGVPGILESHAAERDRRHIVQIGGNVPPLGWARLKECFLRNLELMEMISFSTIVCTKVVKLLPVPFSANNLRTFALAMVF